MGLKPNMYVRTKDDELHKCLDIYIDNNNPKLNRFMNEWGNIIMFDEIKDDPSFSIINLIEVGDYVNGMQVSRFCFNEDGERILNFYGSILELINEDIKSIVTKEQFESMSYKVGE